MIESHFGSYAEFRKIIMEIDYNKTNKSYLVLRSNCICSAPNTVGIRGKDFHWSYL